MKTTAVAARAVWSAVAGASLILLCLGLGQKLYVGSVPDAFTRDQAGNTLILAGAAAGFAAAGWSRYRGDRVWMTSLVAVPAVVIGGLNLVAGYSLLPHLSALVAVPLGLAGIIGGMTARLR
ncbi:hypothetical protein [Arthrobacter sp. UYEF3]|uniref:hypothetical protein n=1 Tax=Arthrobacter sp. UYEF3 TaxID=1756365 RepID=UPI0033937675